MTQLEAEGRHKWIGKQLGGDPTEATSTEWVSYCDRCGTEKTDDNENEACK